MKPEGIKTGKKNNDHKHSYEREQWMKKKREGRPKQIYIYDNGYGWSGMGEGHWEKVQ